MTPITLKSYQEQALAALSTYAQAARLRGAAQAFAAQAGHAYQGEAFGRVPCVCLRIPTGGGKTVLAAHAVPLLARDWAAVEAPVALWLVPSDAIRMQTLRSLQTPGHPYRAALVAAYGEGLRVCTLDEVAQIAPPDWGRRAVVVVGGHHPELSHRGRGPAQCVQLLREFRAPFQGRGARGAGAAA